MNAQLADSLPERFQPSNRHRERDVSELTTSREEADILKGGIYGLVKDFERMGFDKGQIGSAMAGIALAIVQVHVSNRVALKMVDTLRDLLEADAASKQ
jgi:hypothetical protein